MQDEAERHRRMREKQEEERREKSRAEQLERESQERQRREEEEARILAEKEMKEAALLKRQREEGERGKRLQKAESAKRIKEREEAERKAQAEEESRRRQLSPPSSPERPGKGFGIFNRRKDEASAASSSTPSDLSNGARPPQTSHGDRDMDNIKAGGGGAVLGIDAPISAVNAGDRVRSHPCCCEYARRIC